MKKIALINMLIFSSLILFSQGNKNNTYQYNNVIKLSPIEFAWSEFHISYERYFKERNQSLVLLPAIILENDSRNMKKGLEFSIQYRFYLSQLNSEENFTLYMYNIGFYAAPYIKGLIFEQSYVVYDYLNNPPDEITVIEKINSLEAGALMGLQFDITQRIVLDTYLGGGIINSIVDKNNEPFESFGYGIFEKGYTGIKPIAGLQIGITF